MLVTGATAGIGRETAELFARRGAAVIITGRDAERGRPGDHVPRVDRRAASRARR
ncbi:SDR family NAD(P)-dependent oxidoreductase [Streptomyces mirabilis]|uniref:SDR family NAD(P)-dependent oxidoreductase n=1 Tax=Streptomyces mirabilis TaxID=68239 RepID=UPI003F4C176D